MPRLRNTGPRFHEKSRVPSGARVFALILGASLAMAQTAPDVANNQQRMEEVFHHIARRAATWLDKTEDSPVVVAHRSLEQRGAERLLYQALIEVLQEEPARTVFAHADTLAQVTLMNFKIVEVGLTYRKLPAGWFRSGKIRREAKAVVDFDIRHARTGAVYFQGHVSEARADTLSSSQLQKLETPEFEFTTGTWEEENHGHKFWEPVLLAAATGAVIYAFYSLRSH
jgi:hypothetical protein